MSYIKKISQAFPKMLLAVLFFTATSCEKDVSNLKNITKNVDRELLKDKDFLALLENDITLFQTMIHGYSNAPKEKALIKEINSTDELIDYFDDKGHKGSYVNDLMDQKIILQNVLSSNYNLKNLENLEKYRLLYNEAFNKAIVLRINSLNFIMSTGRFSNAVPDFGCGQDFADAWNLNADNYATNALACTALLPPFNLICVVGAKLSLDRQNEAAYATYRECMGWEPEA